MKIDSRSNIQKATDVMNYSSIMAYRTGQSLVKEIKVSTQYNENIVELHNEQCEVLENYFEELHNKTNTYPSCKAQCSGCCKFPIWSTALEFLSISEYIEEEFTEDIMEKVKHNFKAWDKNIGKLASEQKTGDKQWYTEYTNKNVKCPFLVENSCSIYKVRPLSCRTYFMYGNSKSCQYENYPKGSLALSDAQRNIYEAPLANKFKKLANGDKQKEQEMFEMLVGVKLLPYWFLN